MEASNDIIGVVLAGGRSSRMGGGDKCLQMLGDSPLLAHVIARLKPQVSDIVISANGDPARFAPFGLPVVADTLAEFAGPLAGVEAALAWVAANRPGVSWAVTVPGDTPFFPAISWRASWMRAVAPAPWSWRDRKRECTRWPGYGLSGWRAISKLHWQAASAK